MKEFGLGGRGTYKSPAPDFSTPDTAANALRSPNHETRYLAWKALESFGAKSIEALGKMFEDPNPRMAARALWVIGKIELPKPDKLKFIHAGLKHSDPDVRVMSIRLCVQLRNELKMVDIQQQILTQDALPEVKRAILIGIRQWQIEHLPSVWAEIANQYVSGDRWFLEALGIAAEEGHWNECINAWIDLNAAEVGETKRSRIHRAVVKGSNNTEV